MKYAAIIETGRRNYGAHLPDLPGCVATGDTVDEVTTLIKEAVQLHVHAMRADGEVIPEPSTRVIEVEAP